MELGSKESLNTEKVCVACGREFPGDVEVCPDDGTLLTPLTKEPKAGDIFAERYEILGIIGDGGMGKVYKAKHNLMKRVVAIKLLLPHLVSSASALKRFQQEAQAASALNHPNILTVYDFGISNQGMPFMVMDFLEGTNLSTLIQERGHLSINQALAIFTQACSGLAHAHQKGVIHRDLKPANLMLVDYDGQTDFLKVVDFGIAKLLQPDSSTAEPLTHTGEVFGSPLYMSPEQCRGLELDQRSDIYSLACVLYRSVTGRPPFAGGTPMECMYKQVNESVISFSDACPELNLPEALERIIFKAMDKNPDNRYQSMLEFHDALSELAVLYPYGKKTVRVFSVPPSSPLAVSTEDLTDKISRKENALEALEKQDYSAQKEPPTAPTRALEEIQQNLAAKLSTAGSKKMIISTVAGIALLALALFAVQTLQKPVEVPPENAPLTGNPQQQVDELIDDSTTATNQGDYTKATEALERAVKYTDEMKDPNPSLVKVLPPLGKLYFQSSKFELAQQTYERLLPLQKKVDGADSIPVAQTKTYIALSLVAQGNLDDAVPLLNSALSAYKKVGPKERTGYSDVLYGLAKVKTQQGQYAQAINTLNQAISLKTQQDGPDSPDAAAYMDDLGQVYLLQNKLPQAESILNKALAIKQAKLGAGSLGAADTLKNLGTLYFQKGNLDKSEAMFTQARTIKNQDLGQKSLGAAEIMTALAMLYTREQKYAQADALFQQALAIRTQELGPNAPSVKRTKDLYAVLKQKMQGKKR
ncbi:MAG: serine/threonine-protein kinase [Candidatus Obscuribacterales bacterium]|nr:serine/threonine-protein kinase [Candidatus Obscuribacterales bacterium]